MPAISFDHVSKVFPNAVRPAVNDVTLEVDEGELVVLLGPSGCGKTTLIRMVNRLIEPTSGRILLGGEDVLEMSVTHLRRQIGYVIQQVGLFPHMTVARNIATVPRLLGWPKAKIAARVDELLDLVDLPPAEYRQRYPRQLSGGQQQRVGIARAMAADPALMLMDEPFGAIDAITRLDLQNELLKIQQKVRKTIMFVTHDVEEALRLADRIVVMREGRVIQYATPLEILTEPADAFTASLLDTGDVFRQLSLVPVTELLTSEESASGEPSVNCNADARSALSVMIAAGADGASVVDDDGRRLGRVSLDCVVRRGSQHDTGARPR